MSAQSAWLIERADSDPAEPKYWCAGMLHHPQHDPARKSSWTSNEMEAIRFARKVDAEKVAHRMSFPPVRICEHIWEPTA